VAPADSPLEIALAIVAHDGRLLVRRRRGDPGLGEVWEFPGGKRELGETLAEAAVRETREETGLAVRAGPLLCAVCHAYADRRVALHAYLCPPVGSPEVARGTWIAPAELRRRPIPEANRPILDAIERALRDGPP